MKCEGNFKVYVVKYTLIITWQVVSNIEVSVPTASLENIQSIPWPKKRSMILRCTVGLTHWFLCECVFVTKVPVFRVEPRLVGRGGEWTLENGWEVDPSQLTAKEPPAGARTSE